MEANQMGDADTKLSAYNGMRPEAKPRTGREVFSSVLVKAVEKLRRQIGVIKGRYIGICYWLRRAACSGLLSLCLTMASPKNA
jgi:hypothetical protein